MKQERCVNTQNIPYTETFKHFVLLVNKKTKRKKNCK